MVWGQETTSDYDHPGMGWYGPVPMPRSMGSMLLLLAEWYFKKLQVLLVGLRMVLYEAAPLIGRTKILFGAPCPAQPSPAQPSGQASVPGLVCTIFLQALAGVWGNPRDNGRASRAGRDGRPCRESAPGVLPELPDCPLPASWAPGRRPSTPELVRAHLNLTELTRAHVTPGEA